ncbi:undecaprenyl diphosphate synthase family protein [Candidatus Woesearchaeota archaeon]|nr:undecaprenyl diphosphate synthase family protein [Candidatus Woesearchaeota archaeon]
MVEIPVLKPKKVPIHIAINTGSVKAWAAEEEKDYTQAVKKHLELLDELVDLQLKHENRVLTVNLTEYEGMITDLKEFFNHLINDERIHANQVRVFIIGRWYEIDSELSDVLKQLVEKTKGYDKFFLNFCINYDGQDEMLGAIRLIVRKILADKLKEEELTPAVMKENIYTSFFPPPELIIEPGLKYSGILLWDVKGALIYFTNEHWMLFDKKEFEKALVFYNKEAKKEE